MIQLAFNFSRDRVTTAKKSKKKMGDMPCKLNTNNKYTLQHFGVKHIKLNNRMFIQLQLSLHHRITFQFQLIAKEFQERCVFLS